MRAFAQEVSDAREIEDLFHQLKEEPLWVEKFYQITGQWSLSSDSFTEFLDFLTTNFEKLQNE